MGIGPVPATQKLLKRTGMSLNDFDLIEINEAFASQVLACGNDLGWDWNKVNPNGGAIAIGHPLGASGTRLLGTIGYEMLTSLGRRYKRNYAEEIDARWRGRAGMNAL